MPQTEQISRRLKLRHDHFGSSRNVGLLEHVARREKEDHNQQNLVFNQRRRRRF